MTRRIAYPWWVALLVACSGEPDATSRPSGAADSDTTVVDAAGVQHSVSRAPSRIISLVPSATEILVALGRSDLLVARTDFDEIDDLATLPSVGNGLQPNLEAILAADPEVVIYFLGESDDTTPRRLRDAGIRTFAVRPDGVEDVRREIHALGRLTHADAAADSVLTSLDRTLAEIAERVAARPSVRVVFTLGGEPPWVAGPGTYVDQLIQAAGGENVFSDLSGLYAPVSLEEFLSREIDVILVMPGTELPERIGDAEVREVPAFIQLPGPRLGLAAVAIAEILHPTAGR